MNEKEIIEKSYNLGKSCSFNFDALAVGLLVQLIMEVEDLRKVILGQKRENIENNKKTNKMIEIEKRFNIDLRQVFTQKDIIIKDVAKKLGLSYATAHNWRKIFTEEEE